MSAPVFVKLPPEFGTRWVNPFRVDSIEVARGATESVVTIRVREQRIRSLDGLKLTAEQAGELAVRAMAAVRGDR